MNESPHKKPPGEPTLRINGVEMKVGSRVPIHDHLTKKRYITDKKMEIILETIPPEPCPGSMGVIVHLENSLDIQCDRCGNNGMIPTS